ncbi:hypothetical protein M9H77_04793 [Catharanthus roseus]|uniref:Uncharacterized protein n=1 Tax=Catharanthus roseus TaxID=4058 RepID=A0ACC0CF96_CATRO|nr:hypothetical protein M9H77_04793 [Catharanthus roseus]
MFSRRCFGGKRKKGRSTSDLSQDCLGSPPPPKFSFLLWLAVLDRHPTKDRLLFLDIDKSCNLCSRQEENLSHLFFACPFAADIWKSIKEWAGLRRDMSTISSSLKWLLKENRWISWKSTWRKLCFAATLYYVWKCRNCVIFESQEPDRD